MNILLVDDEQHCRENLTFLLNQYCSHITEIRTADSVENARSVMRTYMPDILFLDIQMPEKDGFHLLSEIDTENLAIIFVTAHDEYAIKAIKCGPTAYLLKPVDIEELKLAYASALKQLSEKQQLQNSYKDALKILATSLENRKTSNRICLSHSSKLEIVHLDEVVLLSSDNYYTTFFLNNGEKIVVSKTLKTYEDVLGDQFIRVHRSHIVNLDHTRDFSFNDGCITLSNGEKIPVSRRKTADVINRLKWIS